jgi:hypothetical protein
MGLIGSEVGWHGGQAAIRRPRVHEGRPWGLRDEPPGDALTKLLGADALSDVLRAVRLTGAFLLPFPRNFPYAFQRL